MLKISADSLCRLCGEVDTCHDLFDEKALEDGLLLKIETAVRISIKQDDGLPSGICSDCHSKLLDFTSFCQQCHDTQQRLQEFISIENAMQKTCEPEESEVDSHCLKSEVFDQDNDFEEGVEDIYYGDEPIQDIPALADDHVATQEEQVETIGESSIPDEDNDNIKERSLALNNRNTEEEGKEEDFAPILLRDSSLSSSLSHLNLYESLESGGQMPTVDLNLDNSLPLFDDCASFRKEMDVLLCSESDRQQTESQLSCCLEPKSFTPPNFNLQREEFSLDQAEPSSADGFALPGEQALLSMRPITEKDTTDHISYFPIDGKSIEANEAVGGFSCVENITPLLENSAEEIGASDSLKTTVNKFDLAPQLQDSNADFELESLPSIPSLQEIIASESCELNVHSENDPLLTVNAVVIGASGEIKFQRNGGGVKIVFPPTTPDKTIKFSDLIDLFSLSEVRKAFCQHNSEQDIIQQLIQQGLGNGESTPNGRVSALSDTSSLDLPVSLLSPLSSVCDSWSWEISHLLSGDENSNPGIEEDGRSELNTPVVTFPPVNFERSNVNNTSRLPENTPQLPPLSRSSTNEQLLTIPESISNNFYSLQVPETKLTSSSDGSTRVSPKVFTPLQVQIPEDNDTPIKLSRTLHSCNTYFDELSLGISPVLDLDPNVATVRVSGTPLESSETSIFIKDLHCPKMSQITEIEKPTSDERIDSFEDIDCDMKEVAVDIIIDDGKTNWRKFLPDATAEFIHTISYKCFECVICSKKFRYRFQAQRHIKTSHSSEKPFICALCGATFSMKYYLTRHMKIHNPGERFSCTVCPRQFNRKYKLVEHEQSHKGPPKLKCSDCRKQFNSEQAFSLHVSFCSGNLQFYVCDVCGKTYRGITALNHHRIRHESNQKFKCSMCDSSFHTQWQLVKHIKQHSFKGLFTCNFCSLAFNSPSNLKKHQSKCPALKARISVKDNIQSAN